MMRKKNNLFIFGEGFVCFILYPFQFIISKHRHFFKYHFISCLKVFMSCVHPNQTPVIVFKTNIACLLAKLLNCPHIPFSSRIIIVVTWNWKYTTIRIYILFKRFYKILFLFFSSSRIINITKMHCKIWL